MAKRVDVSFMSAGLNILLSLVIDSVSNAYGSATIIFVILHNVGTGIYEPPNAFIALHKNFQNSMTLISVPNDKRNKNKKCCELQ